MTPKKNNKRDGERAQSVKCLPYGHEDLIQSSRLKVYKAQELEMAQWLRTLAAPGGGGAEGAGSAAKVLTTLVVSGGHC